MPIVHFYLKKPDSQSSRSLIYLQFKYKDRKLVYSFGQKINPADWSKEKNRVKSSRQTILNGQFAINDQLDELEKICLRTYQEELLKGIPPVQVLKFRLDTFLKQKQGKQDGSTFYHLFDRFISGEIKSNGKDKSPNTLKNYTTTRGHLQKFDLNTRYHVHFENINLDFFSKYTTFLKDELKLRPNSIAKDIGVLRTVMNEAVTLEYTTNIQWRHKKFSYQGEEPPAVKLDEQEIIALCSADLSSVKRLEKVRDLFVLACLTGLSYTDCPDLQPENIIRIDGFPFIKMNSKRNRAQQIVFCHPLVPEIFKRYQTSSNKLPKAPSNQKFNTYIKEACQLAGLKERGRISAEPDRELWQCISSHTAHRSFEAIAGTFSR
ncbi:phage integrase SAM-like domain-containing protein [Flavitalea flava]